MNYRLRQLLALTVIGILLSGCGVYSASSGRVDDSIRRVHIPFLENKTSEPTIGIELTELIISAIQEDNTLKVTSEDDASTELLGAITRYRLKEAFTTQDLQVDEYQVQIQVELTFQPRNGESPLFKKKRIQGTGNYILDDPNGSSEQTAREEAAAEIVRGVLAAIVEDW